MKEQRRLAAILAADVVGYSTLMGRDESGTVARLRELRKRHFEPALTRHHGRLVKLMGDGALVEFPSAVGAVSAAIELQQAVADANKDQPTDSAIHFRIGIHVGDLIVDEGDLYGDGVNVAARLEARAPAGGIVVSRTVHEAVEGRLKAAFDPMGDLVLKNIHRPIQAFRVVWRDDDWSALSVGTTEASSAHIGPLEESPPLPDKPSIAVLPFANMSGEPTQDYFVDGMVEEITTALCRSRELFVVARNSSFTYRDRAVNVRQVGRELGVRYILQGSVRKTANRVRIASQLIDATSGTHLWSDRFDSDLADLLELQDTVASTVAAVISPAIEVAEIARASRKASNLAAYDYLLRARAAFHRLSPSGMDEAIGLAVEALALDETLARAYTLIAAAYTVSVQFEWSKDRAGDTAKAERVAGRALALDENDPLALAQYGQVLGQLLSRVEDALALFDRALEIDPNFALAWTLRGICRGGQAEAEGAIDDLHRALRLSPRDPNVWIAQHGLAWAYFVAGRYEEALPWTARVLQARPNLALTLRVAIAANAMSGRMDKARDLLTEHAALHPGARISNLKEWYRLRVRPEFFDALSEGLLRAGMPE